MSNQGDSPGVRAQGCAVAQGGTWLDGQHVLNVGGGQQASHQVSGFIFGHHRAQRRMSLHDVDKRPTERQDIESALHVHGGRHVVGRRWAINAIERPEAALTIRQRHQAVVQSSHPRRQHGAKVCLELFQVRGDRLRCPVFEKQT